MRRCQALDVNEDVDAKVVDFLSQDVGRSVLRDLRGPILQGRQGTRQAREVLENPAAGVEGHGATPVVVERPEPLKDVTNAEVHGS